jgi:CubicO group peptidase (beta-lactamase class C family)
METSSRSAQLRDILRSMLGEWSTGIAVRAEDGAAFKVCLGNVESHTVMYGASLTKQFIGLLMAQLVEAGDVSPEQSIRVFLPQLPEWAASVRLRHLLSHTSGFPVSATLTQYLGLPAGVEGERQWNNVLVLEALAAQRMPQRPPGVVYEYSNAGYICLAEIIQRVCKMPIEKVASSRLFAPLGMEQSYLGAGDDTPKTIGDGGLWTTVDDLLKWNDAMNACHFGAHIHALAETPGHLDDGTPLDYAWGLGVRMIAGERTLSHGGGWPSRCAKILRQPARNISLALLTTCNDVDRINKAATQVIEALK